MNNFKKNSNNNKKSQWSIIAMIAIASTLIAWNANLSWENEKNPNTEPPEQNPPIMSMAEAPPTEIPSENTSENTVENKLNSEKTTQEPAIETENEVEIWLPPANAEFDRSYGYQFDPTFEDYRFHNGVDMSLAVGDLVFAIAEGTISKIYTDENWGDCIEITHGGEITSIYRGAKAKEIAEGQKVIAGDTIGIITESPPAEALQKPHLHLEIISIDGPQNPLDYIK